MKLSALSPLVACALLAEGCVTLPPPPPASSRSQWGVAYAASVPAADRLSTHLEALAPSLRAYVPGLTTTPVDVRFVTKMHFLPDFAVTASRAFRVDGITIQRPSGRWIEQGERASVVEEQRILAHELVHYWIGPDWAPLPHFLEEGLADNVRDHVIPRGYSSEHLDRVLLLASVLRAGLVCDAEGKALGLTYQDAADHPGSEITVCLVDVRETPTARETLTVGKPLPASARIPHRYATMDGIGYLLVSRIGVQRLHALCLKAIAEGKRRLPPEWVLEAAGLPADERSEAWTRAILQLYGPAEQREFVRRSSTARSQPSETSPAPGPGG